MLNYNDPMGREFLEIRKKYDILESELKTERESFLPVYKDLNKFILPRRGRFFINDVNRGERKNTDIIDSTAQMASRTLASGMMTGITSPARTWFRMATDNKELNKAINVKKYLNEVTESIRSAFLKSNLYNVLPTLYADIGTFATGAIFMEEDMEEVFNFISLPVGSYCIGNDRKGRVRVFFREFQMSVRQIVEKFGMQPDGKIDWSNISEVVKNHWENKQHERRVDIAHFITPNEKYNPRKIEAKYKKFKSVYYEKGMADAGTNHSLNVDVPMKFLKESGYDYFPVLAPRWSTCGEDTYGTDSPGMVCLGDVKQLQLAEKRIMQAIDQKVRPSMVGPTSLRNAKASMLPGDITYLDDREGSGGIRRLFEIDFDTRELEMKQNQVRDRISRAYYEDLFLMLAQSDRRQITAREIEERHEEKLLALGPVLERINQDLLDPLIENAFLMMNDRELLPEPPEELQGQDYKIEYISIMAQAQKLAGIGNIERFLGFVGQAAGLNPEAVMKVNIDEAIDMYGDFMSIPQELITSKEEMEAIREQQAAAAQAQQEQMAAAQAVQAGKTLSETKMDEDTALAQVLGGLNA